MDHRYELERYKGMRSRYECPVCHHKGVFVRYIDTETGLYLSPEVGRCNREDKCGYHYTPKQYFDSHPTERPEANIIRHPKPKTGTETNTNAIRVLQISVSVWPFVFGVMRSTPPTK